MYTGIPINISINPHITVSAPEPYIVQITYTNANNGKADFLINILKLILCKPNIRSDCFSKYKNNVLNKK